MLELPENSLSPKRLPPVHGQRLADDEREFTHSSHGSQGGERGNDYQAYWITLAALNAVASGAQVTEAILEGHVEPFDDIQIRYANGQATYFQSKHKDTSGSNNINISELTALPGAKSAKSVPFSLAKYFKGMYEFKRTGGQLNAARFVICVSASFSTIFYIKKDRYTLESNTWTTQGILTAIPNNNIDSLFSTIQRANKPAKQVSEFEPRATVVRFSDNFINNVGLTATQKKLRQLIFEAITSYITKESNQPWVTTEIQNQPKKHIKEFLKNLQLWIHQPKLEGLKKMVSEAVREAFYFDVNQIHKVFYEKMKATSDRTKKSLDMLNIKRLLQEARGEVLAQQLVHNGRRYHQDHALQFLAHRVKLKPIEKLITGNKHMLTIGAQASESLKYLVFSALCHLKYEQPGNNWCIVHADSPPLYYHDVVHGELDFGIDDLFRAKRLKLLVIDAAEHYLASDYGQRLLHKLKKQTQCKIVLLAQASAVPQLQVTLPPADCDYKLLNIPVNDPQVVQQTISQSAISARFCDSPFTQQQSIAELSTNPIWQAALSLPHVMKAFIDDLKTERPAALTQFQVQRYRGGQIRLPRPYYDLNQLAKCKSIGDIRLRDLKPNEQASYEKHFAGRTRRNNKAPKDLYIHVSDTGSFVHVKRHRIDEFSVEVTHYRGNQDSDLKEITEYPDAVASGFFEKQASQQAYQQLLNADGDARHTLVAADYGSGKSSLLNQLVHLFMTEPNQQPGYDAVVPCHLTQMVVLVQNNLSLIDIILLELQRQQLIATPAPIWLVAFLNECLHRGRLLILFDKWDELHENHYALMSRWLKQLPTSVHTIVASRWHAIPQLELPFNRQVELSLFDWSEIASYIKDFFNQQSKLSAEKHTAFLAQLFAWLGEGDSPEVVEILERPLHTALLVEAIDPYYQALVEAQSNSERYEQIQADAPWNDRQLYRLKLYQLIVYEQFRQYVFDRVGAKSITPTSDMGRVNMFTQAHQIKLREIAFALNFNEQPLIFMNAIDVEQLVDELYQIGLLNNTKSDEPEFVCRIFSEYFTAQYLLMCLAREGEDPIKSFAVSLIREHAHNTKYKQIFQLLGEMICYGDPFLNFKSQDNVSNSTPQFVDIAQDDQTGLYYRPLLDAMMGNPMNVEYKPRLAQDALDAMVDEDETETGEAYADKTPLELLTLARANKDNSRAIVKYLVAHHQLTDGWLKCFYHREESRAEVATDETLQRTVTLSMKNIRLKVDGFKWREQAWGGYWDIDAYLPSVKVQHPNLLVMGAAYFIHRVENKNNVYYNSQLAPAASSVIYELAIHDLDNGSIECYFMMLITWLKQPGLINQSRAPGGALKGMFDKIFTLMNDDANERRSLAAYVLYAVIGAYRLRVCFDTDALLIKLPNQSHQQSISASPESIEFFQDYFAFLRDEFSDEPFKIRTFKPNGKLILPLSESETDEEDITDGNAMSQLTISD